MNWNKKEEPISLRLRDNNELSFVVSENPLIYNPRTNETALIVDVFVVEPPDDVDWDGELTEDEDRYVQYVTNEEYRKDWSTDLDDEGWIWLENFFRRVTVS